MKIGFLQFAPVLGDVQANIQTIDTLLSQAREADLLVLPELCNSGYNFKSKELAWETSEEIPSGDFVRYLESAGKKYDIYLVAGVNERDGDRLYNTAVLVGPSGYVGKYRKLHLFLNEKDYFTPGDVGLPLFDIGHCKLGIQICFDWIYPETWRILALKGADVICHPSNLVLPGLAQKAVPIHGLINRVFTITANRIGSEDELTFTGNSIIADPMGNVVAHASPTEEEVKVVEVDITRARDKKATPRNDLFADRRPSEYRALVE